MLRQLLVFFFARIATLRQLLGLCEDCYAYADPRPVRGLLCLCSSWACERIATLRQLLGLREDCYAYADPRPMRGLLRLGSS